MNSVNSSDQFQIPQKQKNSSKLFQTRATIYLDIGLIRSTPVDISTPPIKSHGTP